MSRGLPKLIATDLDGTLVRTDGTVSDRSHRVLERVRASGIHVVGVTGRGPRLIELCRQDIPSAGHLVLAQGGYVFDLATLTRPMRSARVAGAQIAEAVQLIEHEVGPVALTVEALDGPAAPLWGDPGTGWPYPEAWLPRDRGQALAGPVVKAFVKSHRLEPDGLLAVARRVVPEDLCAVTQAGTGYVELSPPDVTKASGLEVVAASLGVDPGDVLVFGDMPNDVPMFAWAGYGVAVANAHPEVRALADDVTLSNDEDGVAAYLEGLLA